MARMKVKKGRRSPMVMHKGETTREQQSRMKWFLNFLNMDIDPLNTVECLKLFLDLGVFVYGDPSIPFAERAVEQTWPDLKSDSTHKERFIKTCQDYLRWLLERSLMDVEDLGGELRFPSSREVYEITCSFVIDNDRITKIPVYRPLSLPFPENLHKDGETENFYRGLLSDAFAKVLSPFLLSRIRTCQKCGNYFYQKTTKSIGDFCSSPKCKNYAATNRWRKDHPDEWKAYMRTYQRERRDKAKQDQVEVYCPSCRYREPRGLLGDYLKSYSGPQGCPRCKDPKLWHTVIRWDKNQRERVPEVYDDKEWNRYLRGIQKGEE
jgi:hypothetical protein